MLKNLVCLRSVTEPEPSLIQAPSVSSEAPGPRAELGLGCGPGLWTRAAQYEKQGGHGRVINRDRIKKKNMLTRQRIIQVICVISLVNYNYTFSV